MNDKKNLLKETVWSFSAKGIAFIFFIILNIFLARYLGPEKFGAWSFFFSMLSIIVLFSDLGINISTRKFVAQYSQTKKLRSILESSLKIRFFSALIIASIFLLLYSFLADAIDRPEFKNMFLFATPLLFLSAFVEYFKALFQGLHKLKYNFFINASEQGLKLILTVLFLIFMNRLIALVYSFNFALLATGILGFCLLYFHFYKNLPSAKEPFGKEILKYSLPIFFATISFTMAAEIDTVMLGFLSNDIEVGVYAVAKKIIVEMPQISLALALGVMPIFARMTKENKLELKKFFHKLLKYNIFIFILVALLILTVGRILVPMIFGPAYSDSSLILVLLTPYLFLASQSIFLEQLLDYRGLAKKRALNFILVIVLNISINIYLIPIYGAVGAAIATSVSYLPYLILNWLEVKKIFI